MGTKAAEEATETGQPVRMSAMTAFERKVVHDAIAAAGLRSESEGVEPARFVVVLPPGTTELPHVSDPATMTDVDDAVSSERADRD